MSSLPHVLGINQPLVSSGGGGAFPLRPTQYMLILSSGVGTKAGDAGGAGGEFGVFNYTQTGGTATNAYERRWGLAEANFQPNAWWDDDFATSIMFMLDSVANVEMYWMFGGINATGNPANTDKLIGVHVVNNGIFLMSSDGTTLSDNASSFLTISANQMYYFELYYKTNTNLKIYRSDVLFDTKTTNLPTGLPAPSASNSLFMKYRIITGANAIKKMTSQAYGYGYRKVA